MSIELGQGFLHPYSEVHSGKNCERCGEFFSWTGHPGVIVEHDCMAALLQRVRALEALQRPVEAPRVEVVVLPSGEGLALPSYATQLSAGADLRAAEGALIQPGTRRLVGTGLSLRIPQGYELQLRARSGLAYNYGVGLVNGIGTIDADYRGEIKVLLHNGGDDLFTVRRGDRIAQAVLARLVQAEFEHVETIDTTERGSGGFGSTGV